MSDTLGTLVAARQSFHDNKPVAYLTQTVGQTIATGGSASAVIFGAAQFDTWTGWSAGSPTVYTVKVSGLYSLNGIVLWTANATGVRDALFVYNASTNITGSQVEIPASSTSVNSIVLPRVFVQAVVGDTFKMETFQTSGGNLNTDVNGAMTSSMTVEWVRM
jgi:hypothetical protein